MVPVRFVSEAFGCAETWDGKTRSVMIKDEGKNSYKMRAINVEIAEGYQLPMGCSTGLYVINASGLTIMDEPLAARKPGFIMMIALDRPNADIPKQFEEAGAMLLQVCSKEKVDEIMAHASQKQDAKTEFANIEFTEGNIPCILSEALTLHRWNSISTSA